MLGKDSQVNSGIALCTHCEIVSVCVLGIVSLKSQDTCQKAMKILWRTVVFRVSGVFYSINYG